MSDIITIVRLRRLHSFIDKSIFLFFLHLIGIKIILIEEGIGLYDFRKKEVKSIRARIYCYLKTLFCYLLKEGTCSFFYEQGKLCYAKTIYCRFPEILKKRYKVFNNTYNPDFKTFTMFIYPSLPNSDLPIFYGCDYISLNCIDDEIFCFKMALQSYPNIIYKPHPRIVQNLHELFCSYKCTDIINSSYAITYKSGSIIDYSVKREVIIIILPEKSELGRLLLETKLLKYISGDMYELCLNKIRSSMLTDNFKNDV